MTFSLRIANGDLVQSGSELDVVFGIGKLQQDMVLWLSERLGVDRFHPSYGSNFQNYIGGVIGFGTQAMVHGETMRVLTNYQRVQSANFKTAPNLFSMSELLWDINNVNVGVTYDQVSIAVNVSNGQQQPTSIALTQGTSL